MNTRKNNNQNKPKTNSQTSKSGTSKSSATSSRTKKTSSAKPTIKGKDKKEVSQRDKSKYIDYKQKLKKGDPMPKFDDNAIRLNKFLSNAGVCSRREADVMIPTGVVTVNGEIITELGYKIKHTDVVKYDGATLNLQNKRYVLLNKPKGFITTTDDPLGRKTVMSLVKKACKELVFPVGKMDKDSTGLLLFTNDGDLMKKLTHAQYRATKLYHVEVNKKVNVEDIEKMMLGVLLEDGKTAFTKVEFVKEGNGKELGIELHSGKNRVVSRMLEHFGYEVIKIDRVQFAGLTKKDLPRGLYRHLTEKEVAFLKMS